MIRGIISMVIASVIVTEIYKNGGVGPAVEKVKETIKEKFSTVKNQNTYKSHAR